MADDLNYEGLKKAYTEMVLKASEAEAERLMFGERRCLCFDHHAFHFKIIEAETKSMNQQMKINELEAQLSEAEEIIVDLREQLRQVLDQLEMAREKNYPNKLLINESMSLDNENSYHVDKDDFSDQKSISLDPKSDGMVENTELDLIPYNPNREEIYLYKNGCTERVCATESNLPPETGNTLNKFKSENTSENPNKKLITNNPIRFDERLRYSDRSSVNLQSEKSLENANDHDNEKTSQNGLGKQAVQQSRSCRRWKNARYREAISVLRGSCRKKALLRSCQNVPSSGVNGECVEVPIEVIEKMPKTKVDSSFVRESSIPSEIIPADSNLVDVPIVDGSRNQRCLDNKGKVIKFTFYRKRRKNVLNRSA